MDASSSRSFARHSHDEFGVGLITDGAQRSWSGRGAVEAGPGDIIAVNPGEVHDGVPIGERRSWLMLYLSPILVGEIVADIRESDRIRHEFHSPVVSSAGLATSFRQARAALTGGMEPGAAEAQLILLVAALLRERTTFVAWRPRCIRLIKERIDDDPSAQHPLDELASLAGLSRFQALRGFTRLTGLTPHGYKIQRRLDLARKLIREGEALASVAVEAGFSDQSHFHRHFVARYGLTPGAYASVQTP